MRIAVGHRLCRVLSISIAESFVISNYRSLSATQLLTEMFYCPNIQGRMRDTRKDTFLSRTDTYRQAVIKNRIVVLSASFETYFGNFLEAFIKSKTNLYDVVAVARKPAGDKLYGEVMKIRGLSERINKFAELAPAKVNQ